MLRICQSVGICVLFFQLFCNFGIISKQTIKKKKKEQDEACKQPIASKTQGISHPVWPPPSHAAPTQDKMETEYQEGGGCAEE